MMFILFFHLDCAVCWGEFNDDDPRMTCFVCIRAIHDACQFVPSLKDPGEKTRYCSLKCFQEAKGSEMTIESIAEAFKVETSLYLENVKKAKTKPGWVDSIPLVE